MQHLDIPDGMPTLSKGSHSPGDGEACIMEIVSLLTGEAWGDRPEAVHPLLRGMAIVVNDRIPDEHRYLLNPLIGWFFGTNNALLDEDLCNYVGIDIYTEDYDETDVVTHAEVGLTSYLRDEGRRPLDLNEIEVLDEEESAEYAKLLVIWLEGGLDLADQVLQHVPYQITQDDLLKIEQFVI